jgi:hypothetical protein
MIEGTDTTRTFETFILPPARPIHDVYKTQVTPAGHNVDVVIQKHHEDGTVEDIFSYHRNYSMMQTFEPFRQFNNGEWHDYALISTMYTRFEVVDLEAKKIIAVEAYPTVTQKMHDHWTKIGYPEWCEKEPVGTERPGSGFCPVEFYVPDWRDRYTDESPYKYYENAKGERRFYYDEKDLNSRAGQYALYMGCVWGDDSGGWKIRYIDLSRISEGVVTSDERYGYIQFAGKSLKEVEIHEEGNALTIPVEMTFHRETGKAVKFDVNWMDDDDYENLDW